MNDIICECGHSINNHYLDRPSYGDAVGYCTHYDEKNHVFCSCQKSPSDIAAQDLARITAERDEYKRQAKLYNDDMMFVRAQRDELRIIAKKLVNCFVVDVECDWWKPNPLAPMSERDIALTELAAALKSRACKLAIDK